MGEAMPTKPSSKIGGWRQTLKNEIRLTHIGIERLEEYSMGRLAPADADRIEEHLLVCNRCRNELVEVEETICLIREALRPSPEDRGPL